MTDHLLDVAVGLVLLILIAFSTIALGVLAATYLLA
jgi:hypothetical protein